MSESVTADHPTRLVIAIEPAKSLHEGIIRNGIAYQERIEKQLLDRKAEFASDRMLENAHVKTWVACAKIQNFEVFLGFARTVRFPRSLYVTHLVVIPGAQTLLIASRIFDHLVGIARNEGLESIEASILRSNRPVLANLKRRARQLGWDESAYLSEIEGGEFYFLHWDVSDALRALQSASAARQEDHRRLPLGQEV